MTIQTKLRLAAVAALASGLLCGAQSALAGTTSGAVTVTATVGSNCILSTVAIAFGTYDPLSATALNGTGQVQLTCTTGAIPVVALDNGLNASGAQRRLVNGGTNFLNYNVFQPASNAAAAACAYTTAFPASYALTAAPSAAARAYNICGQAPAGQSVANGSYSDTITANITF